MKAIIFIFAVIIALGVMFYPREKHVTTPGQAVQGQKGSMNSEKLDTATFGAGCFWCVEAVFQNLKGVQSITSGYSGGSVPNPTYTQVCDGTTGHAEACQIMYNPKEISYAELLEVFWKTHDPTTLNRQGNDAGTQYRSAIFYHNDEQKNLAEHYKHELDSSGAFDAPIVTEIVPFRNFYKAEAYHQNYYNDNTAQPYCMFVIRPKVEKFKKVFKDKLKDEAR
jgi:peptide-methionine (S)-S-oxide reductase